MKALNIFFIALFIFCAVLQYNDPDPYLWIPIYLYGAFLCYLSIRNIYMPWLMIVGLVAYFSFAVFLFFDKTGVLNWQREHNAENILQSMKADKPWIEETREFIGLLLLMIALTVNLVWLYGRNRQTVTKLSPEIRKLP
jgi:hypothetical protein